VYGIGKGKGGIEGFERVERVAGPDLTKSSTESIRLEAGKAYILQRCRPLDLTWI
jgi:hypothetical protein